MSAQTAQETQQRIDARVHEIRILLKNVAGPFSVSEFFNISDPISKIRIGIFGQAKRIPVREEGHMTLNFIRGEKKKARAGQRAENLKTMAECQAALTKAGVHYKFDGWSVIEVLL